MDSDPVRDRIVRRAAELEISLSDLSKKIGKNHAYFQQFVKRGVPANLPEDVRHSTAEVLGIQEADLRGQRTAREKVTAPATVRPSATHPPNRHEMGLDVQVWGNAAGGSSRADFQFNGQIIDHVRRPPGIASQQGVFALYVVGTSMAPKFEEGNLIYVSSSRPALIGDYVVVELQPMKEGDTHDGYIKRLLKRTPTKLVCEQFNPKKQIEFDLSRVKKVYRVIPLEELLGV